MVGFSGRPADNGNAAEGAPSSSSRFAGQRPCSEPPTGLRLRLTQPQSDSGRGPRVRTVLSVPIRLASMFSPALPHCSALWASVLSSGLIANVIGSQAGFRALAQPVHAFANSVC